jgi:predicted dehydrogenase
MASHLEDWHPWESLSEFFMSKASLGGGALLDESHWIDQMLWLFGEPREIAAQIERISDLPIDSDDHVEIQATYASGLRARIHLDLYTRPTKRSIAIYGDKGALKWSFESGILAEYSSGVPTWREESFAGQRNDMFEALAKDFLELCCGGLTPICTVADGLSVMRIVDTARESNRLNAKRLSLSSLG